MPRGKGRGSKVVLGARVVLTFTNKTRAVARIVAAPRNTSARTQKALLRFVERDGTVCYVELSPHSAHLRYQ